MEEKEILTLVSSTALLMEQFERRCSMIERRLDQTWQALEGLTSHVPTAVQRSADGVLREIPLQIIDRVREGIDRPVGEYELRLQNASSSAMEATRLVADQMTRMEKLHRHLVWKVVGVVGGAVALLLVAAIWLSSHYMDVIKQNQLSAELLKAYNKADVTLCGGQLCANVDIKGTKAGDKGQYLPVNPR
ncbi:relaxation protein [Luteibacter aegosomaticola]|uniref:relaxation protein n=1 Tax=Luteibacter aegosomaticola TaxID=2911538 RepID=UPI001FF8BEE8|nr:relaxation protein [Luteibacter aegosomaticola]UPG89749.1 relaxation protein [Luteibacter aegosomaticola]